MGRCHAWVVTFLLALLSNSTLLMAQPGNYPGPHMMWYGGWLGMFFGLLMMIALVAIVVAIVMLIIRWFSHSSQGIATPPSSLPTKTPLDILKERYARGEIDKDEFEERRRVLEQ